MKDIFQGKIYRTDNWGENMSIKEKIIDGKTNMKISTDFPASL